jgi:hypothetical protein
MTLTPPGRKTRYISAIAFTGSEKFLNAAWQKVKSNLFSSNGMAEAFPCRKSTFTPASAAFRWAISTKDWLISRPVIW